jgi:hypothetical protein
MYEGYLAKMENLSGRIIVGCVVLAAAGLFSLVVHLYKKSVSRKRMLQA